MASGFSRVREAQKEIESQRNRPKGPRANWFKLKEVGATADVRFLEENDEVEFHRIHKVDVAYSQYPLDVLCVDQKNDGTPCPGCEMGLVRSWKGWINLIERNAPVLNEDGSKTGETADRVAIWSSGPNLFTQLDELNDEWDGLSSRDFTAKRKVEANGITSYAISPIKGQKNEEKKFPLSDEDKELAKNKADLSRYTTVPSYEDFQKTISGESREDKSSNDSSSAKPKNPFL